MFFLDRYVMAYFECSIGHRGSNKSYVIGILEKTSIWTTTQNRHYLLRTFYVWNSYKSKVHQITENFFSSASILLSVNVLLSYILHQLPLYYVNICFVYDLNWFFFSRVVSVGVLHLEMCENLKEWWHSLK